MLKVGYFWQRHRAFETKAKSDAPDASREKEIILDKTSKRAHNKAVGAKAEPSREANPVAGDTKLKLPKEFKLTKEYGELNNFIECDTLIR